MKLPPQTEPRFLAAMREYAPAHIEFSLSLGDLFILLSFVKLGLRHPGAGRTASAIRAGGLVQVFRDQLAQIDPVLGEILDAGNDASFDVPAPTYSTATGEN